MTDSPRTARPLRVAYLQLGLNIVLFGLSWPMIKIGLQAASPLWFAAARATLSATMAFLLLALLGRLKWPPRADWPIVLSVGALQLACFFAFSNLGMQRLPAGRSRVLAYTASLWVVPLSLLIGEKVGWGAFVGVLLGVAGIVVLADPPRFDWSDKAVIWGHVWLLLALLGRLKWPPRADWPIVLSVGALQLACFFAFSNLGMQSLPAGRSSVLAYTASLWVVPLSLLIGEKVGWRAAIGVLLGVAGIVVLADPPRFDWSDKGVIWGHVWLLLAGFTWAIAIVHIRHHRWRTAPLDALPWQMSVATVALTILAAVFEPHGHVDPGRWQLWVALIYIGIIAGPAGTALVLAGMAIVILENARPRR